MSNSVRWSQEQLDAYQNEFEAQAKARTDLMQSMLLDGALRMEPPKTAKRSKYGSRKIEHDGQKFDSKKEFRRWIELQFLQAGGKISQLQRQVPFVLAPAVKLAGEARTKPALRYVADATYIEAGVLVVEDVKSTPTRKTDAYRIKKHLLATVHGIHIKEV